MLIWISLSLFIAFCLVAAVDGFYYHVHKFGLWAHPDSWAEHLLHTMRAVLAPPMLWAFFVADGPVLIFAATLVGLDVVATALDVRVEPASRRRFGGLPRGEWIAHVFATLIHVAALATAFAARSTGEGLPASPVFGVLVLGLVLGSTAAAVHHVVLAVRGAPSTCCASRIA